MRDVDYCSGVFLLVRAALLHRARRFRRGFRAGLLRGRRSLRADRARPATAWCTIRPSWCIISNTAARRPAAAAQALIARGHADLRGAARGLARRAMPRRASALAARATDPRRRILFIEDTLPLRLLGSGFVRSNDLIAVMAEMGFHVTVFPVDRAAFDLAAVYADFPDTVEVMHDRDIDDLDGVPARAGGLLSTRSGSRARTIWTGSLADCCRSGAAGHLILDTEAIAALRDAGRAALLDPGRRSICRAAMRREFANARHARTLVAVSEAEAAGCARWVLPDVQCSAMSARSRRRRPLGRAGRDAVRRRDPSRGLARISTGSAGSSTRCCRWSSGSSAGRRG